MFIWLLLLQILWLPWLSIVHLNYCYRYCHGYQLFIWILLLQILWLPWLSIVHLNIAVTDIAMVINCSFELLLQILWLPWLSIVHLNITVTDIAMVINLIIWILLFQIFGFLNMCVWAANLWFLYKETPWFKVSAASKPSTPAGGEPQFSDPQRI